VNIHVASDRPDNPSHTQHRRCADQLAQQQPARCAVLTISDTRTPESDTTGPQIRSALGAAGHAVTTHDIVRDEPAAIERVLRQWAARDDVDVIITTGGTGFAKRDGTIDVVSRLIDVPLAGFGELFRMLSFEDVGSAAMLSRAMAGLMRCQKNAAEADGTFIFALPGSADAVRTAMDRLIVPELAHLVMHRRA
jgi:molybdenum cofactor biosynthesis protein B